MSVVDVVWCISIGCPVLTFLMRHPIETAGIITEPERVRLEALV